MLLNLRSLFASALLLVAAVFSTPAASAAGNFDPMRVLSGKEASFTLPTEDDASLTISHRDGEVSVTWGDEEFVVQQWVEQNRIEVVAWSAVTSALIEITINPRSRNVVSFEYAVSGQEVGVYIAGEIVQNGTDILLRQCDCSDATSNGCSPPKCNDGDKCDPMSGKATCKWSDTVSLD